MRSKRLLTALVFGVGLIIALLWLLNGSSTGLPAARAADLHVCPTGCAYSSVQAAVDAASAGDVIKVATGTYTDVSTRAGVTQVVYIDKGVTIRGGYTTAFD
jgi:pectin methylesterase-like acyl-CoA thioesterase